MSINYFKILQSIGNCWEGYWIDYSLYYSNFFHLITFKTKLTKVEKWNKVQCYQQLAILRELFIYR